jgi:antitoxin CptB
MALNETLGDLELRRRRLRYRAWRRGTREMDLVTGRFADATLSAMSSQELDVFESLLEAPDPDLFAWLVGQAPVPQEYDSDLFRRLVKFHRTGEGLRAR